VCQLILLHYLCTITAVNHTIYMHVVFQLTPSEAEHYKDVVGLQYATMAQQNYLPPREQRASFRLQVELKHVIPNSQFNVDLSHFF